MTKKINSILSQYAKEVAEKREIEIAWEATEKYESILTNGFAYSIETEYYSHDGSNSIDGVHTLFGGVITPEFALYNQCEVQKADAYYGYKQSSTFSSSTIGTKRPTEIAGEYYSHTVSPTGGSCQYHSKFNLFGLLNLVESSDEKEDVLSFADGLSERQKEVLYGIYLFVGRNVGLTYNYFKTQCSKEECSLLPDTVELALCSAVWASWNMEKKEAYFLNLKNRKNER